MSAVFLWYRTAEKLSPRKEFSSESSTHSCVFANHELWNPCKMLAKWRTVWLRIMTRWFFKFAFCSLVACLLLCVYIFFFFLFLAHLHECAHGWKSTESHQIISFFRPTSYQKQANVKVACMRRVYKCVRCGAPWFLSKCQPPPLLFCDPSSFSAVFWRGLSLHHASQSGHFVCAPEMIRL